MTIKFRKSAERGFIDHGWLKARHTFSFGDYYDPAHMHYRTLRVINEDRVSPGQGFATHPHKDMEIITYVISGQLAHKDSMGNARTINAGEFQFMSAGSGVLHSEFNPSDTDPVHLLQIWILPDTKDLEPSYAEWQPTGIKNGLTLVGSGREVDRKSNQVPLINQDVALYLGQLESGSEHIYNSALGRSLWLQVIDGQIEVLGHKLAAGDALAIKAADQITIKSENYSSLLLFDLA